MPLLFIAYINDVTQVIKHSSYFLYADDLALVVSGKDPARVQALLQEDLTAVEKWCMKNKLTVNANKTMVMWSYSSRSVPDLSNAALILNGKDLKVVKEFNYLGILLDTNMSLRPQLKKQINLMRRRLAQLRRLRRNTDKETALLTYKQMIRPIVDYCGFLSEGGPVWAVNKLQTLQNDGIRICERILDPRGHNVDALHTQNKVTKLKVTRDRQLLRHLFKMSKNPTLVMVPARNLRGNTKIKLRAMRAKKDIFAKSPLYRGLALWDELDASIQHLPTTRKFSNALKSI